MTSLDHGQLYRVLAETAEDAIVTIDEASVILSVNPAAEQLVGHAESELVGGPLGRIMPERFRERHRAGIARYLATGMRAIPWKGIEIPILRKDGTEVPVQISFGEFEADGRRIFSAIIRDISSRVEAEAALAASAEQLQGQAVELEQQVEEAQAIGEELEQTNEELRSANDELRAARADAEGAVTRLREVLDGLSDAVSTYDSQWRWTYVNPAAAAVLQSLGVDAATVVGRTVWEVLPGLEGTKLERAMREAEATGRTTLLLDELLDSRLWFEHRIVPSPRGVTTFSRDMTNEQRASQLLRSSEAEYRALANSIPSLAWTARADGFIEWYNERWYEYTGTSPADMEGWGWQQVHDPATLPDVLEQWMRSIHTGEPFEMTFPIRGADGTFRRFLTRVAPVHDADGRVTRWFGTNTDIEAERVAYEATIQAVSRTERLQALTAALAAVDSAEDIATIVVDRAATATGARTVALFAYEPGATEGTLTCQMGLDAGIIDTWTRFPLSTPGPSATVLRTGTPIFLESRDELDARFPELAEIWERLETSSIATVPLTVAAQVVGAISFTYTAPRAFTAEQREFYLAVAGQAAQSLERARLRAESDRLLLELDRERTRLADVFREAPVAVAVLRGTVAEELVFEMVNPRYRQLVPPQPDPVGMRVFDALPSAGAGLLDVLQRVLETRQTVVVNELEVGVDRDGDGVAEGYYFTAAYHPLQRDGEIDAIVAVITEVSDSVRARREAERLRNVAEAARAEAEAANRAKGEFLAVMSHELRTPLNAIGGYVELIELGIRGPVSDDQRMDLARIQQSQRHLLGLINEVLNYARLETGSVSYESIPVAVLDALREAEALVTPQARLKGLALSIADCAPTLAALADREKLRQVLVNLLSNAVKFTDAGGTIVLSARPEGAQVLVEVIDTGIGIAAEQLERIFEPFVQVRSDLTRTAEGTGLGLAISRDLARGMGGDLQVESVPGQGSRFTIRLPAAS